MDRPLIERWLATPAYARELAESGLPQDAAAIRAAATQHLATLQAQADAVFNRFLDRIGRPARRILLPSRD